MIESLASDRPKDLDEMIAKRIGHHWGSTSDLMNPYKFLQWPRKIALPPKDEWVEAQAHFAEKLKAALAEAGKKGVGLAFFFEDDLTIPDYPYEKVRHVYYKYKAGYLTGELEYFWPRA